ncbi:MAG: cytochrome P450, partial [Mycobacterium sp.]
MATVDRSAEQCPTLNFDYSEAKPIGTWLKTYDELRSRFPWFRNEFGPGFWTVVNYQGILQIMQDPETFSNSVVVATEPNPPYKWIPEMLDGDEHKQWRHQLAPLFAPGAIERLDGRVREVAAELVDTIAGQGSCDFMAEFAQRFPAIIFLEMMGLPVDEIDQFMAWEHDILRAGGSDEERMQTQILAMMAVMGRFVTLIADRREQPRDDIISKALEYQ